MGYIGKLRTLPGALCLFPCRQELFLADLWGSILHQAVARVGTEVIWGLAGLIEGTWLLSTQKCHCPSLIPQLQLPKGHGSDGLELSSMNMQVSSLTSGTCTLLRCPALSVNTLAPLREEGPA